MNMKSKDTVVHFREGLIGFPNLKNLMLVKSDRLFPFCRLQSIDSPEVGFLALEATILWNDYHEHVPLSCWESIRANSDTKTLALGLVVMGSTAETATGNFYAPILINYEQMIGKQVILTDSAFPVRHPLVCQ